MFLVNLIVSTLEFNAWLGYYVCELPLLNVFVGVNYQYYLLAIESAFLNKREEMVVKELNWAWILQSHNFAKIPTVLLSYCDSFCRLSTFARATFVVRLIRRDKSCLPVAAVDRHPRPPT